MADRKKNNIVLWSLQERRSNQEGGFICCLSKFSNSIEINKKSHLRFLSRGTSCIRFRPQASMHCCSTCGKLAYNLHRLPFFTTSRKPQVQSQSCGSFDCVWVSRSSFLYKNFTNVRMTKSSHDKLHEIGHVGLSSLWAGDGLAYCHSAVLPTLSRSKTPMSFRPHASMHSSPVGFNFRPHS